LDGVGTRPAIFFLEGPFSSGLKGNGRSSGSGFVLAPARLDSTARALDSGFKSI